MIKSGSDQSTPVPEQRLKAPEITPIRQDLPKTPSPTSSAKQTIPKTDKSSHHRSSTSQSHRDKKSEKSHGNPSPKAKKSDGKPLFLEEESQYEALLEKQSSLSRDRKSKEHRSRRSSKDKRHGTEHESSKSSSLSRTTKTTSSHSSRRDSEKRSHSSSKSSSSPKDRKHDHHRSSKRSSSKEKRHDADSEQSSKRRKTESSEASSKEQPKEKQVKSSHTDPTQSSPDVERKSPDHIEIPVEPQQAEEDSDAQRTQQMSDRVKDSVIFKTPLSPAPPKSSLTPTKKPTQKENQTPPGSPPVKLETTSDTAPVIPDVEESIRPTDEQEIDWDSDSSSEDSVKDLPSYTVSDFLYSPSDHLGVKVVEKPYQSSGADEPLQSALTRARIDSTQTDVLAGAVDSHSRKLPIIVRAHGAPTDKSMMKVFHKTLITNRPPMVMIGKSSSRLSHSFAMNEKAIPEMASLYRRMLVTAGAFGLADVDTTSVDLLQTALRTLLLRVISAIVDRRAACLRRKLVKSGSTSDAIRPHWPYSNRDPSKHQDDVVYSTNFHLDYADVDYERQNEKISLYDLIEVLMNNRTLIRSHHVYSMAFERALALRTHPSHEELELDNTMKNHRMTPLMNEGW